MPKEIRMAVLDDYLSLSPPYFANIPHLSVTQIPNPTIPTYPTASLLSEQVARLQPYAIISTMRERTTFPPELLRQLPNLKLLLTTGPWNASIDMKAAAKQGIVVTGTTGAGRSDGKGQSTQELEDGKRVKEAWATGFDSTSQHCWSLILAITSRVVADDQALRTDGTYWQGGASMLLAGKTMGIVGLGRLGARVARTAVLGFGMKVIGWSENLTQAKADEAAEICGLSKGVFKSVGKNEVFGADVVSLHYVLSDRSRGLVGAEELALMHQDSILINTSRAGLIDEDALLSLLKNGKIRGAALDVFWEEPLSSGSVWRNEAWGQDTTVVVTPHMGYVEKTILKIWYAEQAEEVERWLQGDMQRLKIN